jgi:hypothetical protein
MPPTESDLNLTLTLTLDEANLVLEALGQLPYARVYRFIDRIQEQARTQLAQAQPAHVGPGNDALGSIA